MRRFSGNFSDIFYTTDGSVPKAASAPLDGDRINVSGGTKLTVRAICNQPNGDFLPAETFPTVAPPRSVVAGGLHYAYYLLKDTAH